MDRRAARRPAFLAIVVAFIVAVGGVALADGFEPMRPPPPQPGFTAPIVLVCRATNVNVSGSGTFGACTTDANGLTNGETVQVTVGGFNTNQTGGKLQQCTLDLTLCETASVPFTTGSNAFSNPPGQPTNVNDPQVTPTPFVVRSTFVAANGQTVNCLLTPCVIYASLNTQFQQLAACHGLDFLGGVASQCVTAPTPTTTTSPSTSTSTTSTTVAPTTSTSTSTTVAPTTSTSTSTTVAPTTSTSTSTTVAPTTSTSTSTTVAPTTSTSTSTTVAPTTSTSTSTTVAPTTSTSTSTTVAPTSTSSTARPGTTSTTSLPQCAQLQQARAQFNAQIDAAIAAVNGSALTAAQRAGAIAQLQAVRAQGNAQIDSALARCGNPA